MGCYDATHELVPELQTLLVGPEVGELVLYTSKYRSTTIVVRVIARSYVWSPEMHRSDGYHGYRNYDWTVIQDRASGGRIVVDDTDLTPLTVGQAVCIHEVCIEGSTAP